MARKEATSVRADLIQVHDHCPERPYVELAIPRDAKSVVSVLFKATSRDQGTVSNAPPYLFME